MTKTTFIKHRDQKDFSKQDLFPFLVDYFTKYTNWTTWDMVKDKSKDGRYLPALSWGQLKPNATSRTAQDILYINSYIVLDFDECKIPPKDFNALLENTGYRIFWHETINSNKNGIYKYHVFIETNCQIITNVFADYRNEILNKVATDINIPNHDQVCKDVARIMYLPVRSLNPNCQWGNIDGKKYDIKKALEYAKNIQHTKIHTQHTDNATDLTNLSYNDRYNQVKTLLENIEYNTGENDKWCTVAYSIHALLGENGRSLFSWWHRNKCPEYHEQQENQIWQKAATYSGSYSGGSLYKLCPDAIVKKVMRDTANINNNNIQNNTVQQKQKTNTPPTIEINTADCWDSKKSETHFNNGIKIEKGVKTGWIPLDKQIGVFASTTPSSDTQGIETAGVIPYGDPILICASTGVGKTTILSNLILSYTNRNNNYKFTPMNAIIFSMEGGKEMYIDKLLRIATERAKYDEEIDAKLDWFYENHGPMFLDIENIEHRKFFNNFAEAEEIYNTYNTRFFTKRYTTEETQEITKILLTDNQDIGQITMPNLHHSLSPKDIIKTIKEYEYKNGIKYHIVIIDYVQTLLYDGIDTGTSEIQGIRNACKELVDWCQEQEKMPIMASQLQNNIKYTPTMPLGIDNIAQSKNIANMFSNVIMANQTKYDRQYSQEFLQNPPDGYNHNLPHERIDENIGMIRFMIAKTRTGKLTESSTDCMVAICQKTLAIQNADIINKQWVIDNDKEKSKKDK